MRVAVNSTRSRLLFYRKPRRKRFDRGKRCDRSPLDHKTSRILPEKGQGPRSDRSKTKTVAPSDAGATGCIQHQRPSRNFIHHLIQTPYLAWCHSSAHKSHHANQMGCKKSSTQTGIGWNSPSYKTFVTESRLNHFLQSIRPIKDDYIIRLRLGQVGSDREGLALQTAHFIRTTSSRGRNALRAQRAPFLSIKIL